MRNASGKRAAERGERAPHASSAKLPAANQRRYRREMGENRNER